MKILSLLSALAIFSGSFFVLFDLAQAQEGIMAPGLVAPVFVGIGIFQIFIILFLFLFIPIAFIGMILRLLGFKKVGEGEGWRWNLKQTLSRFLTYLLYHVSLFGLWLIVLRSLTGSSRIFPNRYGYGNNFLESTQLLIGGYLILFLIYSVVWAFAGPYFIYFWHKMQGKPTFKPSFGSHIRLALWNIFIFFAVGIVFTTPFIERGVRNPSLKVIERVANTLGVDIEEIIKKR
jgi:hypothetical protein